MNYKQRRQLIQQLVEENHIATQEELLELLKQHGVVATQATVSRDIHSLNIAKVSSSDGQSYYAQVAAAKEDDDRLYRAIANRVVSYTTVEFVNVVKTTPDSSYATILGGMFDELSMPEVAGTIAGNDTLLIISPDVQGAQKIGQLLADNLGH